MDRRYFQWITTERKNEVVIFDKIEEEDGIIYIAFKDGSRINEELVGEIDATTLEGKFMAEVESTDNLWMFKTETVGAEKERWEENESGERVCVQPEVKGRTVTTLIPPKKTKSKFGKLSNKPEFTSPGVKVVEEPTVKNTNDPVYIMLNKAKKVDSEVNMTLTISLPSQSLYDVVCDSFEEGSIKALEYIIESIDISKIKKSLRDGIDSMYNDKEAESSEECKNYLGEPIPVDEPIISEPRLEQNNIEAS